MSSPSRMLLAVCAIVASLLGVTTSTSTPAAAAAADGFRDTTVISGLAAPTAVRFSPDGRVFVAEKRGVVKVFSDLTDTTPTVFADLTAQVHDYWDRGMLGLALPPDFPSNPYVYVLYTYGAGPGGEGPTWEDACPEPPSGPGGNTDGCVVTGRLSRLPASGDTMSGPEQVLITDWCQQYPSHTIGDLAFGDDGSLYVTGGEGASFEQADWGQLGGRTAAGQANPCGDPPGAQGSALTVPDAMGGALRSQSARRPSGPTVLGGTVLRLDPVTGAGRPDNPHAASSDPNARRIIATGLRNPFRFALRPGTSELWLGDVGWSAFEEVNRIAATGDAVAENFGWPCYEGAGRQPLYERAGLSLCRGLYGDPAAVTAPRFAYRHDSDAVPGDGCGRGGSTSGMAFNSGTRYPAEYTGALFFADYSRNCIWAMRSGAQGPDPARVSALVTGASGPVSLTTGPDGYLYYVALQAGEVHRIEYGSTPPPPPPPAGTHFLSDLPTAEAPVNGYGPLERDRSNGEDAAGDGRTLTLDGVQFPKGLGVHAASDVRFTVPAQCTTFTSTVGVDDEVSWGSVAFHVFVGGTQVFDSGVRTAASASVRVSVPVTAGAELRLLVTDGGDGPAYDHADWADAKLLCDGGTPPPPPPADRRFLSDLTPAAPAVNGWGPVEGDRSNGEDGAGDGRTLTLQGTPFAKGLGVHAQSDVRYTVPAGCTSFTSTVGVDDEVGGGSVVFRVLVDGAQAFDSGVRTGSSPNVAVSVPVDAGAELRLLVADGGDGITEDHADWADAALLCDGSQPPPPPPPPPGGNRPPVPVIDAPTAATTWKVGDTIPFSGHGLDPEDGALPADRLSWELVLEHCTGSTQDCHSHPVSTQAGVASGTFTAPTHDYPSYLELSLRATDSAGLTASSSVRLDPQTVDVTFATNPGGLKLSALGVGTALTTTPFTRRVIVGSELGLLAPPSQEVRKSTYVFRSWSDGGAASHTVTAPATPTTYTATYRRG